MEKEEIKQIWQGLTTGQIRVAEKVDQDWVVNTKAKAAIMEFFKTNNSFCQHGVFDKIRLRHDQWTAEDFTKAQIRQVPGSIVRIGSYIGKNVILMPSFVNCGAYIDDGSMIDTWATVGSGAQIGKNCHISGGTGIGGVLEPLQALPVIIEDNCFIGARAEVVEGVIVRKNSVIGMGVFIGKSTKIYDRINKEIIQGEVPEGSVVVAGSLPREGYNLYAPIIVKKIDEHTRQKVAINEILRNL